MDDILKRRIVTNSTGMNCKILFFVFLLTASSCIIQDKKEFDVEQWNFQTTRFVKENFGEHKFRSYPPQSANDSSEFEKSIIDYVNILINERNMYSSLVNIKSTEIIEYLDVQAGTVIVYYKYNNSWNIIEKHWERSYRTNELDHDVVYDDLVPIGEMDLPLMPRVISQHTRVVGSRFLINDVSFLD